MPRPSFEIMEVHKGNLAKTQSSRSMAICRGCLDPKRRELYYLLSTESKIFFCIISQRLSNFLLNNGYIDISVQKGGISGIPGCLEHTGVLSQLLSESRRSKGDLSVVWLDQANAYGSISHKLVHEVLVRHYVPDSIRELIMDYYSQFHLRISSGSVTSDWHRLERGIITGRTISATLFTLAMNMLMESAETECRGPISISGVRQPPIRAYMDDLTVTTPSVTGCRWLLRGLESGPEWHLSLGNVNRSYLREGWWRNITSSLKKNPFQRWQTDQ